ncbi:MAG TPA: CapA family protein [Gaiellaceae bacterium]|nr:CapA family protein [Gaiellaceae bacterium]
MGYSREQLAVRRARRRRRRRARLRGVALLAGVCFVAGLGAALAFGRGEPQAAPESPSPSVEAPGTQAAPAASTGSTTEAAAPGREPPAGKRVTIAAVGDIAMGRDGFPPPGGGEGLFAQVAHLLEGDVVVGNLEQAFTDQGTSKCGKKEKNCFAFRTPPSTAEALAGAGFTVLNLANNHAYDYGQAGLDDTVAALEAVGLAHTGLPDQVTRAVERPVRIAVLGFGFYPTGASLLDVENAAALVQQADRWADVIVVTFHGGAEGKDATRVPRGPETYLGEQRGDLRAFSHAVVDAGADLVVGHGPHVLRGMEWWNGRLIAYSLGNFAGNHTFRIDGPGGVSGVLHVTLRSDGTWVKGDLAPIALVGDGAAVPDPAEAAHGAVRELSKQDFGKRAIQVSRTGVLSPPS